MNNLKYEQLKNEAIELILERIKDGYEGDLYDLHNDVFNTDYYEYSTYKCKVILGELGVFDVIEYVTTKEKEQMGEVYTDLHDPMRLLNALFYHIGEGVINELINTTNITDISDAGSDDVYYIIDTLEGMN